MLKLCKPIGFGGVEQVAEFLGIEPAEVQKRAEYGQWPHYVIGGKRVFNVDELLREIVQAGPDDTSNMTRTKKRRTRRDG